MAGLGETLRQARLDKGLSLDDAEKATRIRKKHLKALEEEDFSRLPETVYVRGFIRLYAQHLGLDVSELLSLLPREPRAKRIQPLPNLPGPPPRVGSWLLGLVVIALMGVGGYYLYKFQKEFVPPTAGASIPLPTSSPTPTRTPRALPTAAPARTPTPAQPTATQTPPTPTSVARTPAPVPVEVPSAIGMQYADAVRLMTNSQLRTTRGEGYHDTIPAGAIASQSPPPGARVPPGSTVSLVVSLGRQKTTIIVPDVRGMPEQQGVRTLQTAGLNVSPWVNRQGHKDVPARELERVSVGAVLSTMPNPGQEVEPGTLIHIAVRAD
ncbi:MAG: helix-turn-helix domain-containing protein [Chloroflexi bacterium]|nr:helix-turn-helix domain-containing protein [Chloroflexota bacterium]